MALTDSQKVDILWKALQGRAASSTAKAFYEEANYSVAAVLDSQVWAQSGLIPVPAQTTSTGVATYQGYTQMTEDVTVSSQKSYTTTLKNWIHPSIDASYQVRVYQNNSGVAGAEVPPTDTSSWVFDYNSGTLTFFGDNSAHSKPYFIKGWTYSGSTGTGRSFFTTDFNKSDWVYDGAVEDTDSITFTHNMGTTSVQVSVLEELENGNFIPTYTDWVLGSNAIRLLITHGATFAGKVEVKPI